MVACDWTASCTWCDCAAPGPYWCISDHFVAKPILYYVSDIDNLTIKSEASKLYTHSLTPDTTMTIVDDAGLAKSTILSSDEPPKVSHCHSV